MNDMFSLSSFLKPQHEKKPPMKKFIKLLLLLLISSGYLSTKIFAKDESIATHSKYYLNHIHFKNSFKVNYDEGIIHYDSIFNIDSTYTRKTIQSVIAKYNRKFLELYENKNYIISETCRGEFGGTLFFKDKKTDDKYACESTCAIAVNEINEKYIITTSLSHLTGFTKIFEIENPKLLEKINPETNRYFELSNIQKSKKGTKTIIDETNFLTLTSFKYKSELYHITSDLILNKTYISVINGDKFHHIQTIIEKSLLTHSQPFISTDGRIFMQFFTLKQSGYIELFKNSLMINYYM